MAFGHSAVGRYLVLSDCLKTAIFLIMGVILMPVQLL